MNDFHNDSAAHAAMEHRSGRTGKAIKATVILSLMVAGVFLSSCAVKGRGLGVTAGVAHPDALSPDLPMAGSSYQASSYRIVVMETIGADELTEVAGVAVKMLDTSKYVFHRGETGPDGSVTFSCRCAPTFYIDGRQIGISPAPDDTTQNLFHIPYTRE